MEKVRVLGDETRSYAICERESLISIENDFTLRSSTAIAAASAGVKADSMEISAKAESGSRTTELVTGTMCYKSVEQAAKRLHCTEHRQRIIQWGLILADDGHFFGHNVNFASSDFASNLRIEGMLPHWLKRVLHTD